MNKRIIVALTVVAVLLLSACQCGGPKNKSIESIRLLLLDANDYRVNVVVKYREKSDLLCVRGKTAAYFALRDTIDIIEMREEYERDLPQSLQDSCPNIKIIKVTLPEIQRSSKGKINNE